LRQVATGSLVVEEDGEVAIKIVVIKELPQRCRRAVLGLADGGEMGEQARFRRSLVAAEWASSKSRCKSR
jgi:hypothetical protein